MRCVFFPSFHFLNITAILIKDKKKMRLNGSSIYNLIFPKVDWDNSVKASYSMGVVTISYCGLLNRYNSHLILSNVHRKSNLHNSVLFSLPFPKEL